MSDLPAIRRIGSPFHPSRRQDDVPARPAEPVPVDVDMGDCLSWYDTVAHQQVTVKLDDSDHRVGDLVHAALAESPRVDYLRRYHGTL